MSTSTAPARRSHAPRLPFAALLVLVVLGGMGLLLLLNTASAANELNRHGFAAQDEAVSAEVQQLHNDVAASAAPDNLARAARSLGMVPAGNPAFLVMGADGSVTVRGSAAPAAGDLVSVPGSVRDKPRATTTKKAGPTKVTKQATPKKATTKKAGTTRTKGISSRGPAATKTITRKSITKKTATSSAGTKHPTATTKKAHR